MKYLTVWIWDLVFGGKGDKIFQNNTEHIFNIYKKLNSIMKVCTIIIVDGRCVELI